ncbi:Target of rapamycin complex 1 subunit kog1 [Dimargaris cristalligena]|nr:Target of rapamycin complex 1 subunit kog1 [Dimargaris cristalligena]
MSSTLLDSRTPPTKARPKNSLGLARATGNWPISGPQSTRIRDTELLPMEEPTYVDNFFSTRRYRHPFRALDRSFRLFDWRLVDKNHTYGAIIALCLRIGIDPPDITKPEVCAKLEAWADPFAEPAMAALSRIAQNLQKQYEFLHQNLRTKLLTDPTIEDTKRYTVNMRRQAKGGRVLFHYNGHGVPKPTRNGDIWVFNSNYTQYMPVSVQDIQIWLGSPGIFVYDCSAAGNILENFVKHAKRKDNEWLVAVSQQEERDILAGIESGAPPDAPPPSSDSGRPGATKGPPPLAALPHSHSVHFAACRGDENLPLSPHLPADVFTACMTTPIEMAMRWWIMRNNHLTDFNQSAITMVPGVVSSRRTPLGEINWIFTAVTDTIAWNTLSKESFKKLFRQDLLTSTLFRNFMLAVRLMRHYNCHPVSYPELPPTYDHHLWGSFESALDECLIQLPDFINASQNQIHYEYMPSDFFTYQLDSFQTYLGHGAPQQAHPELLPIILQVLLSQLHRNRALSLLVDFLKFGRWAVNQCLAVGIFPYVLKLISSTQTNSRGYLAAIWSAIISVDYSVRQELMRSNAPKYFLDGLLLDNLNLVENTPVTVLACRAHCLMVLTHLCRDLYEAQQVCGMPEIVERLKDLIQPNTVTPLRQWSCLFLAELCRNHVTNIQQVVQLNMHECLFALLEDPIPEVRAAAVMALSAFFGPAEKTEHVVNVELIICIALVGAAQDASPVVRKEIVIALSHYIKRYPERFFTLAMETIQKRPHDFYTGSGLVAPSADPLGKRASLNALSRQSTLKAGLGRGTSSPLASSGLSTEVSQILALAVAQRCTDQASQTAGSLSTQTTTTPSDSGEPITHFLGADLLPYDMCLTIWRTVLRLSVDPVAEVAQLTSIIVDFVTHPLLATITAVAQTPVPISLPSDLTELGSQPSATGITLSTSHPVSPRQRSVSHHTSLTSPTKTNPPPHMGGSVRGTFPRHNPSDAVALEALTQTAEKYGAQPEPTGYRGESSGMVAHTTPPTPTKNRIEDQASMASKLTSSLKRSASSTINLMYNLTTGSSTSVHQPTSTHPYGTSAGASSTGSVAYPPLGTANNNPPLTPTPAQMRFQLAHTGTGGPSGQNSPPTPGPTEALSTSFTAALASTTSSAHSALNRQSAIYSYEDPALRALDTQLSHSLQSLDINAGPARGSMATGKVPPFPQLPPHLTPDNIMSVLSHVPYFEPPVEIPLVSKLLEWQTLLVLEPYLRKPEEQQEGSEEYLASAWRKTRNDAIVAQFQTVRANYRKRAQWSKSTTMTVDQVPNLLHFHHYEKQLVVSDAKQTVSIWDWENKSRLHQISVNPLLNGVVPDTDPAGRRVGGTSAATPGAYNGGQPGGAQATSYFFSSAAATSTHTAVHPLTATQNPLLVPKLPRITTVQLINEMDMGILMVGTHDGTLRFFQNYADPDRCEMITGWQNFTEHVQDRRRPTRMVTEWVQRTGLLYVTGSTNTINVWDLSRELCVKKIHSKSTGIVNAIAVDQVGGNLIFCGGSDGVVRVYDERMDQTRCQARVLGDPTIPGNSVIQTILQGGQGRELVSASTDGKVRLWDVGTGRSRGSLVAHSSGVLNHLAVHDNMPIFATAAANSLTAANGGTGANPGGASALSGGPVAGSGGGTGVADRNAGSSNHTVKVWDMDFKHIGLFRHSTGILGRVAAVTALAMHQMSPTIAMGNDDSTVTFISPHL